MVNSAPSSTAVEQRARAVVASVAAPDARKAVNEFLAQMGRDVSAQLRCLRTLANAPMPATSVSCHARSALCAGVRCARCSAYQRERAPFSTIKRWLGLAPSEVTAAELVEWSELMYDGCNMCGRCTLACPMGLDIAGLVRRAREGCRRAALHRRTIAGGRAGAR
ncbi:MAG: hypothetical protein IPP88_15515 [Betaproteobacteria bacterium]|nr:hypothetical protein [Betaproteobacteria bacterium]